MLMAGPQTTNIPGVQPVGRMAFAEMLGWELEAFDEAFGEALREGLAKADWKARLIFVPNAIKHNPPQSINVVKSWAHMWSRVPECELKTEAWNAISEALSEQGENFVQAFKSACPLDLSASDESFEQACGKASDKPTDMATDIQEAVSSKQELNTPQPPKGGGRVDLAAELEGFTRFWRAWPKSERKQARGKCLESWRKADAEKSVEDVLGHVERMKVSESWTKNGGRYVPAPLVYLNQRRWEGAQECGDTTADENKPEWAINAGFSNRWEAENEGCFAHNAHHFRDGRRVEVPA